MSKVDVARSPAAVRWKGLAVNSAARGDINVGVGGTGSTVLSTLSSTGRLATLARKLGNSLRKGSVSRAGGVNLMPLNPPGKGESAEAERFGASLMQVKSFLVSPEVLVPNDISTDLSGEPNAAGSRSI